MAVGSPLSWCFSNFNVLTTQLGMLIKCWFHRYWYSMSEVRPEKLPFWEISRCFCVAILRSILWQELPSAVTSLWLLASGIWKGLYEYIEPKNQPLEGCPQTGVGEEHTGHASNVSRINPWKSVWWYNTLFPVKYHYLEWRDEPWLWSRTMTLLHRTQVQPTLMGEAHIGWNLQWLVTICLGRQATL